MSGSRTARDVDWSTFTTELADEEIAQATIHIGRVIIAFSTLEIQFSRTLSGALGISELEIGDALAANVDAVHKARLLKGISGIFKSSGAESVSADMRKLCGLFLELLEDRNVVAHGTLAKCDGRLLIGSIQLSARLRLSGGTEKWVYFDEIEEWHTKCAAALKLTSELRPSFEDAWARAQTAKG